MTKLPTQETYLLAKSFLNIENARKYLESIVGNGHVAFSAKNLLNRAINRCNVILNDVITTLPKESADIFKEEIQSWHTLSYENIFDMCIKMDEVQRLDYEDLAPFMTVLDEPQRKALIEIAAYMVKGEEIKLHIQKPSKTA